MLAGTIAGLYAIWLSPKVGWRGVMIPAIIGLRLNRLFVLAAISVWTG